MQKGPLGFFIGFLLVILLAVLMLIPNAAGLDQDLLPPVAIFSTSVENVLIYENMTFDASSSYDPNGYNLTYSWDFDSSDGIQEEGSGMVMDHVFKRVGTYTVTLRVSNSVAFGTTHKMIVVYSGSDKIYPPVAVINSSVPLNGSSLSVQPGTLVVFNAEGSYDPNSNPLDYEWAFPDGSKSTQPLASHRFEEAGSFEVLLRVTTPTGKTDTTTLAVEVAGEALGGGEPEPERSSGKGWIVLFVILFILVILVVGGIAAFLFISQRRAGASGGDDGMPE